MPENLSAEEQKQFDIDFAKSEISRYMYELAGLIGKDAAREYAEQIYPFVPF